MFCFAAWRSKREHDHEGVNLNLSCRPRDCVYFDTDAPFALGGFLFAWTWVLASPTSRVTHLHLVSRKTLNTNTRRNHFVCFGLCVIFTFFASAAPITESTRELISGGRRISFMNLASVVRSSESWVPEWGSVFCVFWL